MLWYKNWLETRSRFFFNLVVWPGFMCLLLSGELKGPDAILGFSLLTIVVLCIFASLAGSGVRTQAGYLTMMLNTKSTLYTLSLPVSRKRLLLARSVIGLLESAVLSLLSTVVYLWGLQLRGRGIHFGATGAVLLIVSFGIALYFVNTFFSIFLSESIYVYMGWILIFAYFVLAGKNWIPGFLNLFALVDQAVASNRIPWLSMTGYLAIAAALLLASVKILDRLEY